MLPVALLPSIRPRTSTREFTFFCRSFSCPISTNELPAPVEYWLDCDWAPVALLPEPLVPVVEPVIDPEVPDEPEVEPVIEPLVDPAPDP